MNITIEKSQPWQSAYSSLESIFEQIKLFIPKWLKLLQSPSPATRTLEEQIAYVFASFADQVFAYLLSLSSSEHSESVAVSNARIKAAQLQQPLRSPQTRQKTFRLLGGTKVRIETPYCAPLSSRTKEPYSGVFPQLVHLGFGPAGSPAFESRISRLCTLCPSYEVSRQELERQGIALDYKTLRSITLNKGEEMLKVREGWMEQFHAGTLEAGTQLKGKHVVACIDGGRIRIRTPGQPQDDLPAGGYPPFDLNWREPKLLIIYVVDKKGRRKEKEKFTIDGTFQGPDHAMELLAMHLERLGVKKAASLTFLADGAPWIWNRVDWLFERLEIPKEKRNEGLDFYHGVHHISLALSYLGLEKEEQKKRFRMLRKKLRGGKWEEVVKELREAGEKIKEETYWREIRYLEKHGKAGRLKYLSLKEKGLPRGSGAIESAIRRVVNQKLKGNGIFWKEDSAEAILQLRGVLLSENWEEMLDEVEDLRKKPQKKQWVWEAENRSSENEMRGQKKRVLK